ncbi:MAG: GTPase Era [Clostridiales bacterium]|nr:GTPase Era [Candidatus Coliplasma caballi]
MTRTAFITITGKPNVGKSTLLNALLGEKVAIVSRKPQTTRTRITGILTKGEDQYVFIDTPGLHRPKTLLGEFMMKQAGNAANDSDVILFMIEACSELNPTEQASLEHYSSSKVPLLLVINKVDRVDKGKLAKQIVSLSEQFRFDALIPISAEKGDGLDGIFHELEPFMTESVHFFPDDEFTDQPERQIFAEIIREKALRLLSDEVPHGIAVGIEEYKEKKDVLTVRAELYCEREAHKKIIIGKNGEMLKKIGTYAREEAEQIFGVRVYLDLWVKVKENWRDRPGLLANFGFKDED